MLVRTCVFFAGILSAAAGVAQTAPAVRILVAFYSESGQTEAMANAARQGASSVEGVEVSLRRIDEVKGEEILSADGILLGTPVHWGNLSAKAKEFLDRVGATLSEAGALRGEGRTGGAFCTGGAPASGKEMARLAILAAFLNMRFVAIGGVAEDGFGTLGAQATTGATDPGVSPAELEEARRSAQRFARLTRALHLGMKGGERRSMGSSVRSSLRRESSPASPGGSERRCFDRGVFGQE